jgi:acetyl esterase
MTPSQRLSGERSVLLSTADMAWFIDQYLPDRSHEERRLPEISPLYADLTDLPPARFVVGTRDLQLDDTLFMDARWRAAGNQTHLEIVAEASHGFITLPLEIAEQELGRQEEFLAAACESGAQEFRN